MADALDTTGATRRVLFSNQANGVSVAYLDETHLIGAIPVMTDGDGAQDVACGASPGGTKAALRRDDWKQLFLAPLTPVGATTAISPLFMSGVAEGIDSEAWSPDSRWVSFYATHWQTGSASTNLYLTDTSSGSPITSEVVEFALPPAENLQWLATSSGFVITSEREAFVVKASDHSHAVLHTSQPELFFRTVVPSPSNDSVAFVLSCGFASSCGPSTAGGALESVWVFDAFSETLAKRLVNDSQIGERIWALAWSPDGSRLAYNVAGRLYVATRSGNSWTSQLVDTTPHAIDRILWSPDGEWLAYADGRTEFLQEELWIVHADASSSPVQLSPSLDGSGMAMLEFSPSSRFLAFTNPGLKLFAVAVTGGTVGAPAPVSTPLQRVQYARWAPDGGHLAYSAEDDASSSFILGVADMTGTSPVLATDLQVHTMIPIWSPDSAELLYLDGNTYKRVGITGSVIGQPEAIGSGPGCAAWLH